MVGPTIVRRRGGWRGERQDVAEAGVSDFVLIPRIEYEGRVYLVSIPCDIDVQEGDWVRMVGLESIPPGWCRLMHGCTLKALKTTKAGEVCDFACPTSDPKPDYSKFTVELCKPLDWTQRHDMSSEVLYPRDAGGLS